MPENALYFRNLSGRRLFGVLGSPANRASDLGVVFCHPYGDEKQKSHRAYVSFARTLEDSGIPSIRFDCLGYGDSEGDVLDATLESQVEDTAAAAALLCEQTGVNRIVLAGTRLGASIAALAAHEMSGLAGILLVAPIVNGARYWDWLLRTQQMSFLTRGLKSKGKEAMLADLETDGYIEIAADRISRPYVEQLTQMDLLQETEQIAASCAVTAVAADDVGSAQASELAEHYRKSGMQVPDWAPEPRDFWTSQALYEGYLPHQLYARTTEWISKLN